MEYWVLTMLALEPKLEAAAENYTKQAEEAALVYGGDTFSAFEKVIEINDKKRRIVNMKVLCDTVRAALSPEEHELLCEYVRRSASEIASESGKSRQKVYRDVKRASMKAAKALARIGFTKEATERDYASLTLCARTYARIKRQKSKERAEPPEQMRAFVLPPEQSHAAAAYA